MNTDFRFILNRAKRFNFAPATNAGNEPEICVHLCASVDKPFFRKAYPQMPTDIMIPPDAGV